MPPLGVRLTRREDALGRWPRWPAAVEGAAPLAPLARPRPAHPSQSCCVGAAGKSRASGARIGGRRGVPLAEETLEPAAVPDEYHGFGAPATVVRKLPPAAARLVGPARASVGGVLPHVEGHSLRLPRLELLSPQLLAQSSGQDSRGLAPPDALDLGGRPVPPPHFGEVRRTAHPASENGLDRHGRLVAQPPPLGQQMEVVPALDATPDLGLDGRRGRVTPPFAQLPSDQCRTRPALPAAIPTLDERRGEPSHASPAAQRPEQPACLPPPRVSLERDQTALHRDDELVGPVLRPLGVVETLREKLHATFLEQKLLLEPPFPGLHLDEAAFPEAV